MTERLNVLVSGRSGQVASSLFKAKKPEGVEIIALGRPDLDITDKASIEAVFDRIKPDLVINAAAYTAVDAAETDSENAELLNASGAASLASAAARREIPILHLSTDYVFDGTKPTPYVETDDVAPLGVYGRSKLLGEQMVAEANPKHVILRTAWVYSVFGNNFLKTMLRVAETRDELGVVADQIGNPTSAHDIATGLLQIVDHFRKSDRDLNSGTYHMTASGDGSWADFAHQIFEASAEFNGPVATVKRITSAEWPTPVKRPANSRLDCSKLKRDFGVVLPKWQESTRQCVKRLIETGAYVS